MKFLKKLLSRKRVGSEEKNSAGIQSIISSLPSSAREFMDKVHRLENLHLPREQYDRHLRYFTSSMPEWLTREVHQMVRHEIYRVEIAPAVDAEITRNLVALRMALYNKDYRKSRAPLLSRIFMILFHLAPELLKKNGQLGATETEMTSSFDVEEIIADLSVFNLSDQQVQYTVARILEYNEKNVIYTEDELILMNNSENLRELLEQLAELFQNFVQSVSRWERYRDPVEIGLHPLALSVLDIDASEFFKGNKSKQSFLDIILGEKSAKDLEKEVPRKLRPLFTRDFKLIISAMRNTILSEHNQLIYDTRKIICWYLLLLNDAGELPPQPVVRSLLEKSLQFHRNYYPELIHAVSPVINRILAVLGKNNRGISRLTELYPEEISTAMKEYASREHSETISFEKFIERMSSQRKLTTEPTPASVTTGQYQPEELDYLKRNPDAELGILMMNEKLAMAEKEEPLLSDHYFFPTRESYLKVVLLETLQPLLGANTHLKIVRSLLEKSMDRTKEQSARIMQKLLSRLKEEGMKRNVIEKLLEKQLKKHHIITIIKQELAGDPKWEWILASENPQIHLDTFSRVTGIAFLQAQTAGKRYKITAKYENGTWSITRIAPESQTVNPKK
ncbi:MAG: hypothetical protein GXO70_07840 [Acidobacteria bacterium]|nr:hypothetical protein [Acidobacteriota bacterium]